MPHARSRLGTSGESAACAFLKGEGLEVRERNYRCRWGEIDIIARQGDTLVFVEVRSRRSLSYGAPQESISVRKVQRLIATAETYMQSCPDIPDHWRIDLISVLMGRTGEVERVEHLPHAVQIS